MVQTPDLRVVEIASGAGASYASRLLRHLGASVVKLSVTGITTEELPELDLVKQRVGIDLAAPTGLARLEEALSVADVVIRCGDAGAIDSGMLGLARLRGSYPALITAALTPFGENGPNYLH